MLYPTNLVIPFVVLLPNLIFFTTNPNHQPQEAKENRILSVFEGIGRIGVFILPVFSKIKVNHFSEIIAFLGMILAIGFYYYGWIRYFVGNRDYKLLFSPIIGIPVPLAISPVVYFCLASIILHSTYLLISSVILAIGHIPISLNTYSQLNKEMREN